MIRLSIIIPYYNTYEYTIQLLKELDIQYNDKVEIILVDDGCNETRFDTFDKFKIIHLDRNYGASYAWNRGIEASSGEYIAFIDSDDMITMDYVESLIKFIEEYDEDEIIFNWYDLGRNAFIKHPVNRGIWKAVYKRKICPMFNEKWKYCTDVPFKEQLDKTNHTKIYVNKLLYFYRSNREGSITWNRLHGKYPSPHEQDKL